MKVFTIGYGGRAPEEFAQRLVQAGVRTIVDVRLRPDRASMGSYVKAKTPDKGIESLLSRQGIDYRLLLELGNVFLDLDDWRERYSTLMSLAGDLLVARFDGIEGPACLLCAERRVADCHRRQIAEFLALRGHDIEHLDGD